MGASLAGSQLWSTAYHTLFGRLAELGYREGETSWSSAGREGHFDRLPARHRTGRAQANVMFAPPLKQRSRPEGDQDDPISIRRRRDRSVWGVIKRCDGPAPMRPASATR